VFKHFDPNNIYEHKVITYDKTTSLENVEIVKFEDFVFSLENKKDRVG